MFVPNDQYLKAYQKIKEDALSCHPAISILIFVAATPDALCACRLWTTLLKADYLSHEVIPVVGYDDIYAAKEELGESRTNLRSVIMLNCGGNLDVLEFFENPENITFYIADTFRPLHLANVYADEQVLLFVDKETELSDAIPSFEDYQKGEQSEDDDEEEEEQEDNEEEEEEDGERSQDDQGRMSPRKRRRIARETREARMSRLAEYYNSGSYHGISSATVLYELLISKLNRADNESLWCAIVGLTDQYISEMINRDRYLEVVQYLREEVLRFNPGDDEDTNTQELDGSLIRFEEEFRFMLMRHWSLYDSMFYSTYLATRMATWTVNGRQSLETFIARMGLSLREIREKYTVMSSRLKDNLRAKLEERGKEFDLDDLLYPSFHRRRLSKTPLSASDMVYCLIGLLQQAPVSVATRADAAGEEQTENPHFDYRRHLRKNFFVALDALSSDQKPELMAEGLRLAQEQQIAVVDQVQAIMQQNACTKTKYFRMTKTVSNPLIFSSPLILERLGLFIYTLYSDVGKGKALPVVVATDLPNSPTTLVVGVSGASKYGQVQKNTFGAVFRQAAERVRARFQHDSFSTNLIEIESDAYTDFLQSLTYLYK